MIHFFPKPYPDETLYSIISRYHKLSGNLHHSETIYELFGSKVFIGRTNLPGYINKGSFMNNIQGMGLSPKHILFNHTAFQYWGSFKSTGKIEKIIENISNGVDKNFASNKACSEVTEEYFKHCLSCIEDDVETYGETYWHRIHQIKGVFTCPEHKEMLVKTRCYVKPSRFLDPNQEGLFISLFNEKINEFVFNIFNRYSVESSFLLNKKDFFTFKNTSSLYKKALEEKGYLKGTVIDKELLKKDLQKYYKYNVLDYFGVTGNNGKTTTWINSLLHRGKPNVTIRHILFIIFLCGTISEFITLTGRLENSKVNKTVKQLFGKGPWPCLNEFCSKYKKRVIKNYKLKQSVSSKKYGIFHCECGFKYRRYVLTNEYNYDAVIYYGDRWKEGFAKIINSERDIRTSTLSRELKASAYTINYYKRLLKNDPDSLNKQGSLLTKEKEQRELLKSQRNLWLTYLEQEHALINKKDYRKLYKWLHRKDREWLSENMKKQNPAPVVDWQKRDSEFLDKFKTIINNWNHFEAEGPIKKTKSYLYSLIEFKYKSGIHKNKLPLTEAYINNVLESTKEFRVRKIKYAIGQLIENNEIVSPENIIKITKDSKPESRKIIRCLLEEYYVSQS